MVVAGISSRLYGITPAVLGEGTAATATRAHVAEEVHRDVPC
jgi:hypothetical protein